MYLCAATRIRVRGPRQLAGFVRASFAAARAARATPGNARSRLLGMPPLLWFHTLSVWESEQAMMAFLKSPEHRAAMAGFEEWAEVGKFVRFRSGSPRVSWRRAFRALRTPDGTYRRGVGYSRRRADG